jgi:(p)ppGpp synthase/HD superfamily hydrolase
MNEDATANHQWLEEAIQLAVLAHEGQRDKGGLPYILHPLAVMGRVSSHDAKIVAVLHDVVEDTYVSLPMLRTEFPVFVVEAVDAISKRDNETNRDYWGRVKENPLALEVKLADIGHNTAPERLAALEPSERAYLEKKYEKALAFLLD